MTEKCKFFDKCNQLKNPYCYQDIGNYCGQYKTIEIEIAKKDIPLLKNPDLVIHIDGLSLYAVYGNACLGLKHPGNRGGSRDLAIAAIKQIGLYLVKTRVIIDAERRLHELAILD